MQRLYVLVDDRCGLCRWARRWVDKEPQIVPVVFVPAGSETARQLFPGLEQPDAPEELVVVSDEGGVYRDGSAWVMVLYALRDYREWSLRLGSPTLLPLARQAFALLSNNRGRLSRWFGLDETDDSLGDTFRRIDAPACDLIAHETAPGLHPIPPSRTATAPLGWRG